MKFHDAVAIGAVCLLIVLLLLWWRHARYLKKHRYIGFGWSLGQRIKDGCILVTGVLPDSPADRAGATPGLIVSTYDGKSLVFKSESACEEFFATKLHLLGDSACFELTDEEGHRTGTVTLKATWIQGPIPRPPRKMGSEQLQALMDNPDVHCGMSIDQRTGAIIPTFSLTDEAVNGVLGRH